MVAVMTMAMAAVMTTAMAAATTTAMAAVMTMVIRIAATTVGATDGIRQIPAALMVRAFRKVARAPDIRKAARRRAGPDNTQRR
ncbi:hypothetical protein CO656_04385 [Sinorhizobium sp. FG01]|nr:hypothetical protein CO656_04385 [Sinorhizobium sp. FG01]